MTEPSLAPPKSRKPNLYDFSPDELSSQLRGVVSPEFRVRQISDWLERGTTSFESMSNLPHELRSKLGERFSVDLPHVVQQTAPSGDGSEKSLFALDDGSLIEAVFMPMGERVTLCLSSQAGCAVGCTFCVTGFFGAGRNLEPSEMLAQYFRIRAEKGIQNEKLNIVFMGMGEPLLNFENLARTLDFLYAAISPKRITVSTSGIIPAIDELAKHGRRPNLAVSINAPDRERREQIMPITRKYPLDELIASLRRYPLEPRREITIEYVLLAGYNDSPDDALKLATLIGGLTAKVNAIPFNPDPNLPPWMKRPGDEAIDRFARALVQHGARVTVRRSKGLDLAAACGQLRGKSQRKRR